MAGVLKTVLIAFPKFMVTLMTIMMQIVTKFLLGERLTTLRCTSGSGRSQTCG